MGTLKYWLTLEADVGRTPYSRRGPRGPNGLFIRPGEDWSPPDTGPRTINMKDIIITDQLGDFLLGSHRQRTPDGGENWNWNAYNVLVYT